MSQFHNSQYRDLLPGVPSVESPFFDAIFASEPQHVQQIATELRNDGYAVIDFPEAEFDQISKDIKDSLTPLFDAGTWDSFMAGDVAHLRIQDAWETDENVRRIATNQGIIDLLSKLYGAQAWPFQTLNFPIGSQQMMHSDVVHFHSAPERFMCGVWVALEDVTLENGPLFYYPGSHRLPIYTNEHIGVCVSKMTEMPTQAIYEPMWKALVHAHRLEPKRFLAKKGQALIWAANLLHGGSPHLNRQASRWSQVTHYFFEGCAYYTPLNSDPFYGRTEFRELKNIQTGKIMRHRYAGCDIPDDFIQASLEGHVDFDAIAYLQANPDVAQAGTDALEHYLRFGRAEKRRLRPFLGA